MSAEAGGRKPRGSRARAAKSVLGKVVLAASLAGMACGGLLFHIAMPQEAPADLRVLFFLPLALSAAALVASFFMQRLLPYYIALLARVLMYLLTVPSTANVLVVGLILLCGVLAELALFEPYPANIAETMGVTAAVVLLSLLGAVKGGAGAISRLMQVLPIVLVGGLVSLFGSYMTRFRELAVDLFGEQSRLTNSVVQLTRANSAYQDFAVRAQETAAEKERQRITRDIHDVVGYTLTNNIMLLEAAMDLMQENPLALPSIIETARANAEEGLGRIRSALYELRRQEAWYPVGVDAINRLVRVFEQATAIRVKCDFCNLPRTISERVDSTLYHLVQESLVNAFRHARATEVGIVFWHADEVVQVQINDNGVGADDVKEGIGIRGMRERVESLGGSLSLASSAHGFTVRATIPSGARSGEIENPDTHR